MPAWLPSSADPVGNNRLETFGDTRYRYDAHGNLIEKRIGRHTHIRLLWDVEHQLQEAIVTRTTHGRTQTTRTRYRYDAFGRRLSKETDGGQRALFDWDGNRLLAERTKDKRILYLYEPDSFAPLAQVIDETPTPASTNALPAGQGTTAADATALADDDLNWNPHQAKAAFMQGMLREARAIHWQKQTAARPEPARPNFTFTPEEDDQPKTWKILYYHTDQIGTPREPTDEDGNILWRATYKAWGNILQETYPPILRTVAEGNTLREQWVEQEEEDRAQLANARLQCPVWVFCMQCRACWPCLRMRRGGWVCA